MMHIPTDELIIDARNYLKQLPPHVAERKAALLLKALVAEIEQLRLIAHPTKLERLRGTASILADEAARNGIWDQAEPAGQGLPDGETWAHYCQAMEARQRYRQLTGKDWGREAVDARGDA